MPGRYLLLACEILTREIGLCLARTPSVVDVRFLPKGLHDVGAETMRARIQAELHTVDPARHQAALLGYGLCNNGLCGLRAAVPLVAPRAHDCITLLLGSRERYAARFREDAGTYYQSPGWIERDVDPLGNPESIPSKMGLRRSVEDYARDFGHENACYLVDVLGNPWKYYRKLAFIDTGVGDPEAYAERSRREAAERGWEFERVTGGIELLQRLVDGDWPAEDFLVVPPGKTIRASHSDSVVAEADPE